MMMMSKWWEKMVFPLRHAWISLSSRVKRSKSGNGLLKLHEDVETCEYQDVRVMWEMLQRSESLLNSSKRKQQAFWRIFVWPNQSKTTATLPT